MGLSEFKHTYNEMHTMMLEVANLCNERPIGVKPNLDTSPEFLSPNSLFLGRCSERISGGPFISGGAGFDDSSALKSMFLLVQAVTDRFWKLWSYKYFPSLLLRQKWHYLHRNLEVGDVCLLRKQFSPWRMEVGKSQQCLP